MNFCSITFIVFFTAVFLLYWIAGTATSSARAGLRRQNMMLLAASLFFYGWWDWRFLLLLLSCIGVTYGCALKVSEEGSRRGMWTWLCVGYNVLVLFFFKYFNFFSENLQRLFRWFGSELDWFTLEVLLPVGISFYTFQAISYFIDVRRGTVAPERDPLRMALFLSYFPQLVAGPIERATSLMPQLREPRRWDAGEAAAGLRQALWGAIKKVVVADACAMHVEPYFSGDYITTAAAVQAVLFFSVQLYCDFSGYCDIACGVSRCLGIRLMQNFRYPYFAPTVRDFWRRWNVSMMMWLRDYVYIPLGGSRCGKWLTRRNTIVTFLVSGIWHGAAWNFIIWGLYWGLVMVGADAFRGRVSSRLRHWGLPLTVAIAVAGWGIFRAGTLAQAWNVTLQTALPLLVMALLGGAAMALLKRWRLRWTLRLAVAAAVVLAGALVAWPSLLEYAMRYYLAGFIALMFLAEWASRRSLFPMERFGAPAPVRLAIYWVLVAILVLNQHEDVPFIYFQF